MTTKLEIKELYDIIKNKISNQEEGSYSYELAKSGVDKVSRKVGEEALEVVIAAFLNNQTPSPKNKEDLIGEICDLFYHTLVLMAKEDINLDEILEEFEKRNQKHK
ncbi:MAG: phosphoribosyl-ATP diphosphatase [Rickettsiales bacterium]|nr:phosphoribosyl-ATP diphosphatase [Rickettsiales bacterium]